MVIELLPVIVVLSCMIFITIIEYMKSDTRIVRRIIKESYIWDKFDHPVMFHNYEYTPHRNTYTLLREDLASRKELSIRDYDNISVTCTVLSINDIPLVREIVFNTIICESKTVRTYNTQYSIRQIYEFHKFIRKSYMSKYLEDTVSKKKSLY